MGMGGRNDETPDSGQATLQVSTGKVVGRHTSRGGAETNRWCLIESDPGVFTELVEKLGVQGVAFEEVFGLDEGSFASILRRKPLGLQNDDEWGGGCSGSGQSGLANIGSGSSRTDDEQKMDVDMQEERSEKQESEMQRRQQEIEQKKNRGVIGTHKEGTEGQERKVFGFIFLFNWSKDKKGARPAQPNRSPASAAAGAAALARQQKAAREASKRNEGDTKNKEEGRKAGEEKEEKSSGDREHDKDEKADTHQRESSSSGCSSSSSTGTESGYNSEEFCPEELFFARQVIPNACASQAILSVLINKRKEIPDVGPTIGALVEFTKDFFDPFMRGEAIANSEAIREAHNSFKSSSSFYWAQDDDDDNKEDAFHFVSYIYFQGHAYEIDGLEEAPKCLGACTETNWTEVVRQQLLQRVAMIQETASGELRFNLMAVVEDELSRLQKDIMRQRVLAQRANVKRICLGEDLTLEEEVEDDHLDATDIPSIEELPDDLEALQDVVRQSKEKRRLLQMRELEELDIRARWKKENVRRRHDFVPFLLCLLRHVARRGELVAAVEEAKRETAARLLQSSNKDTTAAPAAASSSSVATSTSESSGKSKS